MGGRRRGEGKAGGGGVREWRAAGLWVGSGHWAGGVVSRSLGVSRERGGVVES
jgi:hypothetical protein